MVKLNLRLCVFYVGVPLGTLLLLAGLLVSPVRAGSFQWTSYGPNGGNVTAFAVNPTDPSIIYAGTNGGGVYRSLDTGATWTPANNGLNTSTNSVNVSALVINPANPNIIYAGTRGGGVFRSDNAGASWTAVFTGLGTFADNVVALVINLDILFVIIIHWWNS